MDSIYAYTEVRSLNIVGAPQGVPNTGKTFTITGPEEAKIKIYSTDRYDVAVNEVLRLEGLGYQVIKDKLPKIDVRIPETRYLPGLVR